MTFRWWNLNIFGLTAHPALVCVTLLCELIDIAALMPMLPDIATAFFDGSLSFTSTINGIFNALSAFISLVCVPVIGSYSDKFGRQRFLLLSIIVFNLHIWVLSFEMNLWFYYATQAFSGISAFGLSNAYVTDIVPQEKRGAWFGIIAVSLYASLLVGALPGLFLGHAWVFRLCGIIALVNVLYVWLILPESIDERDKLPQSEPTSHIPGPTLLEQPLLNSADPRSESPLLPMASDGLATAIPSGRGEISPTSADSGESDRLQTIETPEDETTDPSLGAPKLRRQSTFRHGHHNPWVTMKFAFRTPYMTCLSLQVLFSSLGEFGLLLSVSLYMSQVLHFSPKDLSYLTIILAISSVVFMVGLYLPLSKRFGERLVIIISLVVSVIRSVFFCFAKDSWEVYALQCLSGCILMSFPAQATLLAKNTIASEQGLGQGAFAGLRQLATGLGPLVFSLTFSYFVSDHAFVYFPQIIYVLNGIFSIISLFFAIRLPDRDETVHGSPSADSLAPKDSADATVIPGGVAVTNAADSRVLQEILSSENQILPLSE